MLLGLLGLGADRVAFVNEGLEVDRLNLYHDSLYPMSHLYPFLTFGRRLLFDGRRLAEHVLQQGGWLKLWIVSELGQKYLTDFVRRPLLLEDLDQEAVATELKLWQKEPHLDKEVVREGPMCTYFS